MHEKAHGKDGIDVQISSTLKKTENHAPESSVKPCLGCVQFRKAAVNTSWKKIALTCCPYHDRTPRSPKPLSSKSVLGMTLHRKSVQSVRSPRSPPFPPASTSKLWAQTAWIKLTLLSRRAPCGPRARELLPPSVHYILSAVSLQGCHTMIHLTSSLLHTLCNGISFCVYTDTSIIK